MSEQEKIFVGSGKVVNTKTGFSFLSFTLGPKDIEKINARAANNNGYCKLNIMSRKEPSDKGITHYSTIDMWKPEKKEIDFSNPTQVPF